ncbi:uncharacterized protein RCC_08676 [Ramularia collo-cygni]|uniref:Uncharacterized protein n=1 Tax=Ramularia collo-cygni TaxID=112498 RepID=A0A2D3VIC5_9PEZI|nr:uncharacterized protein RCC_08676 [Ramularia collo-cygni]CZT22969.1 uncharacterized protein RCC_08676 [Ramularia collo-cygni]
MFELLTASRAREYTQKKKVEISMCRKQPPESTQSQNGRAQSSLAQENSSVSQLSTSTLLPIYQQRDLGVHNAVQPRSFHRLVIL